MDIAAHVLYINFNCFYNTLWLHTLKHVQCYLYHDFIFCFIFSCSPIEFGGIGKTVLGCDIVNLSRYIGISLSD